MDLPPLYRRYADHYLDAIQAGSLNQGDRMPSIRTLMRLHNISLSTAIQVCRQLEADGWLEARPRIGYFIRQPRRLPAALTRESNVHAVPDPAQYVGIHARVSSFIAKSRQYPITTNLAAAHGAPELYPEKDLKNIALRLLRRNSRLLVAESSHSGNTDFKAVLARRTVSLGLTIAPEDVLVTHGGTEALNLALRAVAQPGDTIAVESPTFYGLLQILESLGLRALEIPTTLQTGISIDAFELALQAYDNIKAVVVMPHLQNPLGSIMPDAHKIQLVRLCEEHRIPLIEDDTYGDLAESNTPLAALKTWDRSGNVIYCSSLDKVLAPGMRLGWMSAGRLQARVEMLKFAQTRQNAEWPQIIAAEFMGSGAYDRHLRHLRSLLRTQREKTAAAIATYFPPGVRLSQPNGGVTLWIELPNQSSSETVFDAALQEGILIAPGSMFSNSNRFEHFCRINCGLPYSNELDHALYRLGQTVASCLRA